jgi:hypothetical protein
MIYAVVMPAAVSKQIMRICISEGVTLSTYVLLKFTFQPSERKE